MKKYSSTLVTIACMALFIGYGFLNPEIFSQLGNVALWALVAITIGKLINIWTTGLFTKWTVEAFTDRLSQRESFVVAVLTAIGNFFGPLFGGLGIRAIYLKKYHRLPYSKFTATLIGYYLIMFQCNNVLALASLIWLQQTRQTGVVALFFGVWILAFAAVMFLRLPARSKVTRLTRFKIAGLIAKVLYDIESGWKVLIRSKRLLWQMVALALINLAALYVTNYVEFVALGVHVTPAAMGLYTAIVQASLLLSLTPGAIGTREAILLVLGSTIGITNQQIIQVAILDRGVYFVLLAVLFLLTRHSKFRQSMTTISVADR